MPALYQRNNQLHDRGVNLAVISVVFTFVAVCLVASRLASRLTTGRKLHEDDYAIIASMVCLPLSYNNFNLILVYDVLILCRRSSQLVLVLATSLVSTPTKMDLVTLSSYHQTELSIGAAHGIGKVSTSLPPDDIRKALQVSPPQAESDPLAVAIISRFFSGILGSSDPVQIHNHSDKDLNLSPLSAYLHDQEVSANGACYYGLCDNVRFCKHNRNNCSMRTTRAHLEPCCSWDMHQPHGFLVRECCSEHHWRLLNTCPAYARCQKIAAT